MVINLLDRLHGSGELKALYMAGVISFSSINNRKIYHTYKDRINNDVDKGEAVKQAADVHNVSYVTVYTAIKKMEIPVSIPKV
jgi:ArsR family metal-binding transcriptional regulator